jgi:transposase
MKVYLGIDWSQDTHAACFVNETGGAIARLSLAQSVDGLDKLDRARAQLGVTPDECWVGIETAHSLVVDFLWARQYSHLFVIPPAATHSACKRYRQSGAQNDSSAAFVIADMVRTDQQRLIAWRPDSALIQQLRAKVSLLLYLTQQLTRTSNRLHAVLVRYYPAALAVFSQPMPPLTWHFIIAYPTPKASKSLSFAEFEAFARQHHYRQAQRTLLASFARLQQPQPQASEAVVLAYAPEAALLSQQLLTLTQAKTAHLKELGDLFDQHSDADLFRSFPGTGDFLAPALLAKCGDDRERFPSPTGWQCLAGTCPITDQSGHRRRVLFRKACDHEFRAITQQWAMCSLSQSVWAATYWEHMRPNCASASDAYRRLANRWLAIAWRCWQDRKPYDEAYHLQQRAQRQLPRSAQ